MNLNCKMAVCHCIHRHSLSLQQKLIAILELSLLQISKVWTCIQTSVVAGFGTVYGTT